MKLSLHNLFQLDSLSGFFHISVINESLFQQEMRFSFPLFPFIHPSPLPSFSFCFASSLHPHLHSSTVSPSGLLATFLCWFLSLLSHRHGVATAMPNLLVRQNTTGCFQSQKTPLFNYSDKLQRNLHAKKLDLFTNI